MPEHRTKAFVLKRTNYGETDRIIQVITEDSKRSLIARGVRKEKSKLAGGIELFSLIDITVHSGRGELDILTSARLVEFYSHILEDYDYLEFAYQALKQISRCAEQIDSSELFSLTNQTLAGLNQSVSLPLVQTWFYLNLAHITGTDLNLMTDTNGMKLVEDALYIYDAEQEVLKPLVDGPIGSSHIKLLRLLATNSLSIASKVQNVDDLIPDCLSIALATNKC